MAKGNKKKAKKPQYPEGLPKDNGIVLHIEDYFRRINLKRKNVDEIVESFSGIEIDVILGNMEKAMNGIPISGQGISLIEEAPAYVDLRVQFLFYLARAIDSYFPGARKKELAFIDGGCGRGIDLGFIAERYPLAECIGYDPDQMSVDSAQGLAGRLGLKNLHFYQGFHENPEPEYTRRADILFANSALGIPKGDGLEQAELMGAAKRVVDGGLLIISGITTYHPTAFLRSLEPLGLEFRKKTASIMKSTSQERKVYSIEFTVHSLDG